MAVGDSSDESFSAGLTRAKVYWGYVDTSDSVSAPVGQRSCGVFRGTQDDEEEKTRRQGSSSLSLIIFFQPQ